MCPPAARSPSRRFLLMTIAMGVRQALLFLQRTQIYKKKNQPRRQKGEMSFLLGVWLFLYLRNVACGSVTFYLTFVCRDEECLAGEDHPSTEEASSTLATYPQSQNVACSNEAQIDQGQGSETSSFQLHNHLDVDAHVDDDDDDEEEFFEDANHTANSSHLELRSSIFAELETMRAELEGSMGFDAFMQAYG